MSNEILLVILNYLNNDECYRSFNVILQRHYGSHFRFQVTIANISFQTEFSRGLSSLTIDHLAENYIELMYTLVNLKHFKILYQTGVFWFKSAFTIATLTSFTYELNASEFVYLMDSLLRLHANSRYSRLSS